MPFCEDLAISLLKTKTNLLAVNNENEDVKHESSLAFWERNPRLREEFELKSFR